MLLTSWLNPFRFDFLRKVHGVRSQTRRSGRQRRLAGAEILEVRCLLSGTTVTNVSPNLAEGTVGNISELEIEFSGPITGATFEGHYSLVSAGNDGALGTVDDATISLTTSFLSANGITLNFAALSDGAYRVTVKDTLLDSSGSPIDGDANGHNGGDFVRDFLVGGILQSWGNNGSGQLGTGGFTDRSTPGSVSGTPMDFIQIAAGRGHMLGLKSNGTVWAWGDNGSTQLGTGGASRFVPNQVIGLTDVVEIAASRATSYALKSDGTVFAWGDDDFGQLGDGANTDQPFPVQVTGLTSVVQIDAGSDHALARLSDGTVKAWGYNAQGQLGDGTTMNRNTPVTVSGGLTATQITAGANHSLAILNDTSVRAWGFNSEGQLGNGSQTNSTTPVIVTGLGNVASIAAGDSVSYAVLSNGDARAWGRNSNGEIGDSTTTRRLTPVPITGLSGVLEIDAGSRHALAFLDDGSVRAWGYNSDGQIGDGTTLTDRTTAVLVNGLKNVITVSAGGESSLALRRLPLAAISIARQSPFEQITGADELTFRVTFNQPVTDVDASDFEIDGPATTISNITAVSSSVYDVTVSGGDLADYAGEVGLNFAAGSSILSAFGQSLPEGEPPRDETYEINNPPTDISPDEFNVDENQSGGVNLGTLFADDPDSGDVLTFSIIGGADMGLFQIGGTNNDELILDDGELDFESKSSYEVEVQVIDLAGNTYSEVLIVTINNLPEAPTDITFSGSHVDDNASSSAAGTLGAVDGEQIIGFDFELVAGDGDQDNSAFQIIGDTVQFTITPDYEQQTSYSFRVRATDDDNMFFEKSFVIQVVPANDNSPIFQNSATSVSVADNLASAVIFNAVANDADVPAQTLTYSISGGADGGEFQVNSSGHLSFVVPPSFASPTDADLDNIYQVEITVSDGEGLSAVKTLDVEVLPTFSVIQFDTTTQIVNEDVGTVTITIVSDIPATQDVFIPIVVPLETATRGVDYEFTSGFENGFAFLAAGSMSTTVTMTIADDSRFESGEIVQLNIPFGSNFIRGVNSIQMVQIDDNDLAPTVAFTTYSQTAEEGAIIEISAILTGTSDLPVTVPISYLGSASGADFSGPSELFFAPGQQVASAVLSITDPVVPDGEPAELIIANLGNPTNATLASSAEAPTTQVILIPQNDAPTVSFVGSFREIGEDAGTVFVDVQLSNPSIEDIVIPFTVGGSADGDDRTVVTTSPITILAGQTSASVEIQILDDGVNEPGSGETIEFRLENPTSNNAILGSTQTSVLRIDDNDIPRVQFVADTDTAVASKNGVSDSIWENGGTITYTVTLSLPSTGTVIVPITVSGSGNVADDYAQRGSSKDFTTSTSSLTFDPGETSITRTVTINNDTSTEDSEKILITLLDPTVGEAILGKRTKQTITIKDNDPLVSVKGSVNEVKEGNAGTTTTRKFTVSLSDPTNVAVVVPLVWGGTADRKGSDRDYGTDPSFPSSITIPVGQTSRTIDVDVRGDNLDEKNETITLTAKDPTGEAKLSKTYFADTITIEDDDSPPTVSWVTGHKSVTEGGPTITYKLRLNKPSGLDVTVDLAIHEHGAGVVRDTETPNYVTIFGNSIRLNPYDFGVRGTLKGDKVVIPAGETEATFKIVFYDDNRYEGNEAITLQIEGATNAKIPTTYKDQARGLTINDNDQPPPTASQQTKPSSSNVVSSDPVTAIGSLAIDTQITSTPDDFAQLGDLTSVLDSSADTAVEVGGSGDVVFLPGTIALPITGAGSNGLFQGATVFFDANFNGQPDFLDLNGDGIQGEEEPLEPTAITGIDGAFWLLLPLDFDVNGDSAIGPEEGRLVMFGGTDTSIGVPSTTRLTAPLGTPLLTPLSTVVENLMRGEGVIYSDALTRVSDAFRLGNTNFATTNPVYGAVGDDALATATERASVKLSGTVLQIARLFSGVPGAPPLDFLADAVYAEVANRIVAEGASLDLSVQPVVADLVNGVGVRIGLFLSEVPATHAELVNGAAEIIAAANQRMDALNNTGDVTFLTSLFQIKKVAQAQAAPALQQITAGTDTLANVLSEFTGANLDAKIAAATIGQFIPPALFISNGAIVEGNSGQQLLELTVNLVGDHSLPVSVEFSTGDDIATAEDNDYTPVFGSLSWDAGDNTPRTIQIPIHGDNTFEVDENFRVFLSNATNAAVRVGLGYAFILNDEVLQTTPSANGATSLHTLAVSNSAFVLQHDNVRTIAGQHASPFVATIHGTDDVDDTFVLDLSPSSYRADSLTFVGGGGTGFDTVEVFGGNFATITQRLTNATDGQTEFDPGDGAAALNLNWTGMEPFLLNVGLLDELIFELPAGITDAILEDADPTDTTNPGMMQLRSPSGAFETTIFANPTTSILIRAGDGADTITIGDLDPDFVGTIQIDVAALGFDPVLVQHTDWTTEADELIEGVNYHVFSKRTAPDQVLLKIQDPVAKVEFNLASSSDSEAAGNNLPKLLVNGVVSTEQTIDVTITGGSADEGTDFTLTTTVTIPVGTYDGTPASAIAIPLIIENDDVVELMEDIQLLLADPSSGLAIADANNDSTTQTTHTYTITDNDTATFMIDDVTVREDGTATFTVSLSNPIDTEVTVGVSYADGSTESDDFTHTAGSVTFTAGSTTSQTVTVAINNDNIVELSESFLASLSPSGHGTRSVVASDTGAGTITDNDTATFAIDDVTVAENGTATFTVSLSNPIDTEVTVNVNYSNDTATGSAGGAAADFDNTTDSVTFAANSTTSKTVTVGITDDLIVELDEAFLAALAVMGAGDRSVAASDTGTGTITNNDTASITVNDVSASESGSLNFTVSLSKPASEPVTVVVNTANGTASTADYTAITNQTITFAPGEISKPVSVTVNNDTTDEDDQTVLVNLSDARFADTTDISRVVIGDNQGQGTIQDNDAAPTLMINDLLIREPATGTVIATFTVGLSAESEKTVKVNFATANNSAVAPGDYLAKTGTLTFAPSETSKPVPVTIKADTTVEQNERFFVNLTTPMNATIADNQGIGTILQDTTRFIHFTGDVTRNTHESVGTFTANIEITNSAKQLMAWDQPVTVSFTVPAGGNGTATNGLDYTLNPPTTITIPAGATSAQLNITIIDDQITEQRESFRVQLVSTGLPSKTQIGAGNTAIEVRIDDNDVPGNRFPANIVVPKNSTLAPINGISVSANGAGNNPIQITLSGILGTLTLGSTTGLTFVFGNGTNSSYMVVQGTVANINAALAGLKFTPLANFAGTAYINMSMSDLGNNTLGYPLTDNDLIKVTVR